MFFLHVYMSILPCLMLIKARRGHRSITGVIDELPHQCWELNTGLQRTASALNYRSISLAP